LTANGVRQARALVRRGGEPDSGQDACKLDDARMRLYAEARNRRSGIVPLNARTEAQILESVQARSRKAGSAERIEDTDVIFRI